MRFLILMLALLGLPLAAAAQPADPVAAVNETLDALHEAAAKADGPAYFALYTDAAIYIGTDATERWTMAEFKAFAEPFFARGRGWTYRPRERHVTLHPCRCIAWFDELLDSESYGTTRGTGVVLLEDGRWKVAQYALSFPVPNDLAKGIVAEIKAFEARPKAEQK